MEKEIIKLLGKLANKYPTQRLGQLLENYVFVGGERGDKTSVHMFYQKDGESIQKIKKNLN